MAQLMHGSLYRRPGWKFHPINGNSISVSAQQLLHRSSSCTACMCMQCVSCAGMAWVTGRPVRGNMQAARHPPHAGQQQHLRPDGCIPGVHLPSGVLSADPITHTAITTLVFQDGPSNGHIDDDNLPQPSQERSTS